MTPAKKAAAAPAEGPVLAVRLASLATLLDLPAGTEVKGAKVQRGVLHLTLEGVDWENVRGWQPRRGVSEPEQLTADYSVDAHGHRTLTALVVPGGGDSGGIAQPDPIEDKE